MRAVLFGLAIALACAQAANVFCCSPIATDCRACTEQDNIDKVRGSAPSPLAVYASVCVSVLLGDGV